MICEICNTDSATCSIIASGKYYRSICKQCKLSLSSSHFASSGHAEWCRKIDAEDHEGDIAQPWDKNGKPNKLFIKLYPDKAKHLFTKEEMRRFS